MRRWFAWTLGLSAFLVFWCQPLIARCYLPSLGGAAAVWATSLCLFQILLCCGYLYAHALQTFLQVRWQAALHLSLWLLIALTIPPLSVPPAPTDAAWSWLASVLLKQIGPAFFWLSATAPLLQHWFARSSQEKEESPYQLYVASNLGSFLALLAVLAGCRLLFSFGGLSRVACICLLLLFPAGALCGRSCLLRLHI